MPWTPPTYGEIKQGLPDLTDAALDALYEDTQRYSDQHAERDLAEHIEAEKARRENA